MHADDLPRATKLLADLKLWQAALQRADYGVFASAHIRVVDAAHGHQGQTGESIIPLEAAHVQPICEHHIARLKGELRELGVEGF